MNSNFNLEGKVDSQIVVTFADNLNDHYAYPRSLFCSLARQICFRPLLVIPDHVLGRPWVQFEQPDKNVALACSIIPTNLERWILCCDHLEYLWLQHLSVQAELGRRPDRRQFESNLVESLSTDDCMHIFTWSQAAQGSFMELFRRWKLDSTKISVLYPSVPRMIDRDPRSYPHLDLPVDDTMKLLMVDGQAGICGSPGRKNLRDGVKCFRALKQKGYPISLIVVGDTEELPQEEHLYQLPRLEHRDLLRLYEMIDIFLFLSRQDSFGYSLLEALAAGAGCIAASSSSLPAVAEIIDHGKNGYLVDYRIQRPYPEWSDDLDGLSLLTYVQTILDNPNILTCIRTNARKAFERGGRFSETSRDRQFLETLRILPNV